MTNKELAYLGIEKLRMRFQNKINPEEYYLSYSGGLIVIYYIGLLKKY